MLLTFSHSSHSWSPSALSSATRVSPAASSGRRRWRRRWKRRRWRCWWSVLRFGSGWCEAGWQGRRSSSSASCPPSSGQCSMGCARQNCLFVLQATFVCLFVGAAGSKHRLDQEFWSWAVLASEAPAWPGLPCQTWPLSQGWQPFFHNSSESRIYPIQSHEILTGAVKLNSFLRFISSQIFGSMANFGHKVKELYWDKMLRIFWNWFLHCFYLRQHF